MSKATSSSNQLYKGKAAHRSWPQLPEEILRHIATFYLWDLSANGYCPQIWDARENWHQRMVFTTLRDANELEKHMMAICPQWQVALQTHLFWQQAVALIDPGDVLAHHAVIHPKNASLNSSSAPAQPTRLTPYRHFRNITNCSCFVCRINLPNSSVGLTLAKRFIHTPYLRTISLCRDHDRRPAAFCGICLRDAPVFEENVLGGAAAAAAAAAHENMIAIIDNDDKESFPGVEATCRACRSEWLWKRVCDNPKDMAAIGGEKMVSDDWETRNIVDSFIDLAEGNIKDVITLAKEKYWLRTNTRLNDMLLQALAASRFNSGRGYDGEEPEEEEEEEDEDEDDIELMQMEESGVRDLALGDWARSRILDGHWFSPADIWYNHALPGRPMLVRAIHPCPWTRDSSSSGSSPSATVEGEEEEEVHPRASTANADIPPTYSLCEQAFMVHQRQMRVVLLPAMRNVVRKIVIECASPGAGCGAEDPAIKAARMTMEDVLTELREEEGVWFDGVDWAERKMNDRREKEKRERDASGSSSTTGSDDSSTASSDSRSSKGTSPVLSTTTLQTTPSPPPLPIGEEKEDAEDTTSEARAASEVSAMTQPVTIAVAPVLDPPRLLRPIPYVPVTASHFPHYTLEAMKMVWREACAPLYHCRCGICVRAMAKANVANGNAQGQAPPVIIVPSQVQPQAPIPIRPELVTVKLDDVIDLDGEGEDEVELLEDKDDLVPLSVEDEYEELVSGSGSDEDEGWYTPSISTPQTKARATTPAPIPTVLIRPRKRSCDEVELEHDEADERSVSGGKPPIRTEGTPPKRARRDDPDIPRNHLESAVPKYQPTLVGEDYPRRMRKRSSEELEEASDESANKRIKVSSRAPSADTSAASKGELTESPPLTSDYSRPSSASLSIGDA